MKLSEGRRVDGSPVLLARNPGSLIPINLNLINYKGISCELYMAFWRLFSSHFSLPTLEGVDRRLEPRPATLLPSTPTTWRCRCDPSSHPSLELARQVCVNRFLCVLADTFWQWDLLGSRSLEISVVKKKQIQLWNDWKKCLRKAYLQITLWPQWFQINQLMPLCTWFD